jgi:hypothetical protein
MARAYWISVALSLIRTSVSGYMTTPPLSGSPCLVTGIFPPIKRIIGNPGIRNW